jgi:hypothetical protein
MTDIVEEMAKAMCEADLELVALVKRAVNVEGDSDSPIRVAAANDLYRQVDDRREQYQRAAQAAYTIVERRIGELEEALSAARLDLNHLAGRYGEQEFVAPTICRIIASLEQRSDQ